jgi:hypothetical protein
MRNLTEIIEQIQAIKSNIENAEQTFKNSNNEIVKEHSRQLIKQWKESLWILNWVIETENTLTNKENF